MMTFFRLLLVPALACSLISPCARGEGLASLTPITTENHRQLPHHQLEVGLKSQGGVTTVTLSIRAGEETPYCGCSVRILKDPNKPSPAIASFDVAGGPLPVSFAVADELVDHIKIRYYLKANDVQGHYFTVDGPTLRKLVKAQAAKP